MNKKWEISKPNEEKVKEIENKYQINSLLAKILVNRGITTEKDIKQFLSPTRKDFYDPYLMPDMEKAVERILKAIESKEKVLIYGDYDVDGITSVTVLKSFLKERGLKVDEYIPNRLDEGYGLNKPAVKKIAQEKYTLMITVDCGISAIQEVKYANSLGIEVIITDHHEPGENLPEAIAVVDSKRKDNKYPFRNLAGVGVVFKLIQAISQKLELEEKEYLKYLDIVCIGTISDIVPLVDENRVIVKLGLMLVEQTKNLGLKTILQASGYQKVDSTTISFGIAPRINACGRMGHQEEALKLFLSTNREEVVELAEKLNEYNRQRQEKEKQIFIEALEKIKRESINEHSVMVIDGENWHHGVIGIVASKITEMYFKPSILLCFEGEEGKGSGRSIPGFDLHEALTRCEGNLEKFGGHSMAIGLSVKKEKVEQLRKELDIIAQEKQIDKIVSILRIDAQVELKDINMQIVESLKHLEPFGEENRDLVFVSKSLKIQDAKIMGKTEPYHLKITFDCGKYKFPAIFWKEGERLNRDFKIGDKVDVLYTIGKNVFNGSITPQMIIIDIEKSI